jgi:hypothetical protein
MDYRRISENVIEILPGQLPPETILEEMARLSYELAQTNLPSFAQPFDIPSSMIDFKDLFKEDGLRLDYLNGRLCSTFVQRKGNRYFFDSHRFEQDRGSAELFLALVKQRLEGSSERKEK